MPRSCAQQHICAAMSIGMLLCSRSTQMRSCPTAFARRAISGVRALRTPSAVTAVPAARRLSRLGIASLPSSGTDGMVIERTVSVERDVLGLDQLAHPIALLVDCRLHLRRTRVHRLA